VQRTLKRISARPRQVRLTRGSQSGLSAGPDRTRVTVRQAHGPIRLPSTGSGPESIEGSSLQAELSRKGSPAHRLATAAAIRLRACIRSGLTSLHRAVRALTLDSDIDPDTTLPTIRAILSKLTELEHRLNDHSSQLAGLEHFLGDMRAITQQQEIDRLEKELQQLPPTERRQASDRRRDSRD
jgi:hypothetical protein